MSEGQSTGEIIPSEQRYQKINEELKKWAEEEQLEELVKGKEIPEEGSPPIVARHSPAGIRFSRSLDWPGGQILEVWAVPGGSKPDKKLEYAQTKYDKDGKKLSWRKAWYGDSAVDQAGAPLRQDFDIFERFEHLKKMIDKAPKPEPRTTPSNVVDITSLRNRKAQV